MLTLLLLACTTGPDNKDARGEDTACDPVTWHLDADEDGYGGAETQEACHGPAGFVLDGSDCDDEEASVHPGSPEACDGLDNDCDEAVDEGFDRQQAWTDADRDGYGDPASLAEVCELGADQVTNGADCDDADGAVNPGAVEVCNGRDDDCDALVDDEDTPVEGETTWFRDADADGWGGEGGTDAVVACAPPDGYGADTSDCDDADATVNPGAEEVCLDLVDQDCDGYTDDYTGDCEGSLGNTPPTCDTSATPASAAACVEGVAALSPSGAPYGTVQAAMDAASPGDVLTVCPGTWREDLVQGVSPLTLVGFGSGTSVLNGSGSVLTLPTGGSLTLLDLDVTGGDAPNGGGVVGADVDLCVDGVGFTDNRADRAGGAIQLSGTGTLVVSNSTFRGNTGYYGGALGISGGGYTVAFDSCTFEDNEAEEEGGALYFAAPSSLHLLDCRFAENRTAVSGGAISYSAPTGSGTMILERTVFEGNVADYEGGALSVGGFGATSLIAVDCAFVDNVGGSDAGAMSLSSWDATDLLAFRTEFSGNRAGSAGAVKLGGWGAQSAAFEGCVFDSNVSYFGSGAGGALYLGSQGSSDVLLLESTVVRSESAGECGAAAVSGFDPYTLRSADTDWGVGATDNSPNDICVTLGAVWDGVASFTCTAMECS